MKLSIRHAIGLKFDDLNAATAFFRVSKTTVYRWIKEDKMPETALSLLTSYDHSLKLFGDSWRDWRIIQGVLVTPVGRTISQEQLEAYSMWLEHSRSLDRNASNWMAQRYRNSSN